MERIPTTSRLLDRYYHINGDTFEKQYKETLSGFRQWEAVEHAEEWLLFPKNLGESICIDETAPSNGELYTIVSNRASRGGKRSVVREITMDMSNSMWLTAKRCFPNHTYHRPFSSPEAGLPGHTRDAHRTPLGCNTGRNGCDGRG